MTKRNAIHLVLVWSMTDKIVYEYLLKFDTPIIKICPILSTIRSSGENHCINELSFPMKVTICEGAIVMLLKKLLLN